MKIWFAAAALFLALCPKLSAQKAPPKVINLIVNCTCTDSVGKGYARSLRDLIAQSPRYAELDDSKENRKRALLISVVTLPWGDDTTGSAVGSAISVVFVFDGGFIDQYAQTCGENLAKSCAQKTLDSVDTVLNSN